MSVETWIPRYRFAIEQLCAAWGVPVGLAVGWIETESGGRIGEVTSLDERGLFQLMPDESKQLGIDHQRLSTDASYSLAAGMRLIDSYRNFVRRTCAQTGAVVILGSEYEWRLVKLSHSMGMGSVKTILGEAVENSAAASWEALQAFALGRDADYLHRLHHAPSKWFPFVQRVFEIGAPYGTALPICEGVTPPPKVA